jgi:hypothetical protein
MHISIPFSLLGSIERPRSNGRQTNRRRYADRRNGSQCISRVSQRAVALGKVTHLTSCGKLGECMGRNQTAGGLTTKRSPSATRAVIAKHEAEAGKPRVEPKEPRRTYAAQVKVIDPDGHEIINLTKLAFEDDLYSGLATLDIRQVLELLVEAAGEWSA